MAFPFAQLAYGITKGYSEEETKRQEREAEKQRTRALRKQADDMEKQAALDDYIRNNLRPQLATPPQVPAGQPSQPAQQQAPGPGAQPGIPGMAGQIQMPPGAQPPRMGGAGIPGMQGTPGGPAPIRPYTAPGQGPAAGAQQPPQIQLPPPPPSQDEILAQRTQTTHSPMKMFTEALAQLEKAHPGDPKNTEAAMKYVEKFKPIFDSENQAEAQQLKQEIAATKAANEVYKAILEGRKVDLKAVEVSGKQKTAEEREARLATLTPAKLEELLAKTGLERARAKTVAQGVGWTDEERELLASLAEKNVNLPVGMRSQQQIHATLQGLLERNRGKSTDEIADEIQSGKVDLTARTAEARTVGAGVGRLEWATNEIDTTAPLVLEASARVPRGSFMPINKLLTQYRTGVVQDPDQKELAVYINSMLNAYDLLAARGGTDVKKREEAHQLITQADSPEALERGISAFQKEAAASEEAAQRAMRSARTPPSAAGGKKAPPKTGDVQNGYRFKGGDPSKAENWEKV